MSRSMLAAVAAAAMTTTAFTPVAAGDHHEETTMSKDAAAGTTAVTTQPAPPAASATTAVELSAAYPDLVAAIRTEAASAERARILGIEGVAMAGHEALVAEMKADGKTSPEQAALRIVQAEKAARGQQLQAIKDVEAVTGAVVPAPTAAGGAPAETAQAGTPEGWKAEYAASPKLQAEFGTEAAYVAYQEGVASGRIRVLAKKG